ncbi:MAG: aminotransferase class V-fold PLP-dependent enzyme [Gemmatimonadota bacterium]
MTPHIGSAEPPADDRPPVPAAEEGSPAALERWRRDTPGCGEVVHLNNAGAALEPTPVLEAMQRHLRLEALTGGYEAADQIEGAVVRTYAAVAALLGCEPRNVALVENATAAFNQAVAALDLGPGDALVTTRCDYNSNQLAFLSLARRRGVAVLRAEDLPEGGVDAQSVRELLRRRRCRLVCVSWVPTSSGLVQDVEAVGEVCEAAVVPYLVDACQAVGQLPVDVGRLRCDYLSATARKFLRGPRGVGFLYVSDRALARGDAPLLVDMRGATWREADVFELAPDARRFENWEFSYALVLGLGEAAAYALQVGVERGGRRAAALASRARAGMAALRGARPLDRGRQTCAIATAAFEGLPAERLVRALRERGINTAATLREYAVLDMDDKRASSALRVSPHYYNTDEEVDALVSELGELAGT